MRIAVSAAGASVATVTADGAFSPRNPASESAALHPVLLPLTEASLPALPGHAHGSLIVPVEHCKIRGGRPPWNQ